MTRAPFIPGFVFNSELFSDNEAVSGAHLKDTGIGGVSVEGNDNEPVNRITKGRSDRARFKKRSGMNDRIKSFIPVVYCLTGAQAIWWTMGKISAIFRVSAFF